MKVSFNFKNIFTVWSIFITFTVHLNISVIQFKRHRTWVIQRLRLSYITSSVNESVRLRGALSWYIWHNLVNKPSFILYLGVASFRFPTIVCKSEPQIVASLILANICPSSMLGNGHSSQIKHGSLSAPTNTTLEAAAIVFDLWTSPLDDPL